MVFCLILDGLCRTTSYFVGFLINFYLSLQNFFIGKLSLSDVQVGELGQIQSFVVATIIKTQNSYIASKNSLPHSLWGPK